MIKWNQAGATNRPYCKIKNSTESVTVDLKETQIMERLSFLPDPQERLSALVARGAKATPLTMDEMVEENLVKGCVSQVWLVKEVNDGVCHFRAGADSPLVLGLVVLICDLCDNTPAAELVNFTPSILQDLGIWRNLSPTRQRGLESIMQTIRTFADSCH